MKFTQFLALLALVALGTATGCSARDTSNGVDSVEQTASFDTSCKTPKPPLRVYSKTLGDGSTWLCRDTFMCVQGVWLSVWSDCTPADLDITPPKKIETPAPDKDAGGADAMN